MVFLSNVRRYIFIVADKLTGGFVMQYLKEIQTFLESDRINENQLNRLLVHARITVPYYKKMDVNSGIRDFPVVNKSIIKSNIHIFLSDKYSKDKLFSLTTSGSTGTPFTIYQDVLKKKRNTADTMVFANKAGYQIGEKLYYLKIWSEANKKSFLIKYMQNIETVDVLKLDENALSGLLKKFTEESGPFGIIGYASALESLCKYCDTYPDKVSKTTMNSMISISETLSSEVKQRMTKYFGIPVVARYSNVENGILGQHRLDGTEEFELNHASYYFEILDMESDKVLPDGEIGRIVITDLYNFAMPMIRYDTGDIGCIIKSGISGKRVLTHLEGRKLDVLFNTRRQMVSSLLVYKNMWKYKEIDQYQLIQKGPQEYTLKISAADGFQREEEIIREYRSYLGEDAVIQIEIVSEIPLLASGKRRKVVQQYYT